MPPRALSAHRTGARHSQAGPRRSHPALPAPAPYGALLGLQQAAGNRATSGVVQRLVMTDRQWATASAVTGRARSAELLGVDSALAAYNAAELRAPAERVALLESLTAAVATWKGTKASAGWEASIRAGAVRQLEARIPPERGRLQGQARVLAQPTSYDDVVSAATELHRRAGQLARQVLASSEPARQRVARLEIFALHARLGQLGVAAGRFDPFARHYVLAMGSAVRALAALATGLEVGAQPAQITASVDAARQRLKRRTPVLLHRRGSARRAPAPEVITTARGRTVRIHRRSTAMPFATKEDLTKRMRAARAEIDELVALAGPAGGEDDFEAVEHLLDVIDAETSLMGYQGTGGVGNEGLQDIGGTSGPALLGLDPGAAGARDRLSGASDVTNAMAGLEGDVLAVYQAILVLRDPKASPAAKAQARRTVGAKAPASVASRALALTGGALTWRRGEGHQLAGATKLRAEGVDVSTEVKLAGDFFGFFSSIVATLESAIALTRLMKAKEPDPSEGPDPHRQGMESVGEKLHATSALLDGLAGNYKVVTKLAFQLRDKGQVAAGSASQATTVSTGAGLVPVIGLIHSVASAVRQAHVLSGLTVRRADLQALVASAYADASLEVSAVTALELARDALGKQVDRATINLGHAIVAVGASTLDTTPVGLGPGIVTRLSSSALKLGQVGARQAKFGARSWKAGKRAAKGKTIGYAEWERQKKAAAAARGRPAQLATLVKLSFIPNWDKARPAKERDVRLAALTILERSDPEVLAALGVTEELAEPENAGPAERLAVVVAALTKRE